MLEERKTAPKRVSDSFRVTDILYDSDVSEDYDNDPVFFSFDDAARVQLIARRTAVAPEGVQPATAQDEDDDDDAPASTKKPAEE